MKFTFSSTIILISLLIALIQAKVTVNNKRQKQQLIKTKIDYSSGTNKTLNRCKTKLQSIVYDPKVAALAYFHNLSRQIQSKAYLWFNPTTRVSTVEKFCSTNGVSVSIYDAMGHFIQYPSLDTGDMNYVSPLRASALNSDVYSRGSYDSYYSFQMFSPNAEYMLIDLIVNNTALPLNNFFKYNKCSHKF